MLIRKNIVEMTGYTPGEQPRSLGTIIKLNTNENPYPPSPKVGEAIRSFNYADLRLYPDPVFSALRKRLAEINGCSPDQVFVGNGSDEILSLATHIFVEPVGGAIGYFEPSYSLYPVLTDIVGVRHVPCTLGRDFAWRTPPAECGASLFFLTNPNAPTGIRYDDADVAAFCKSFPGVALIDEAYVDFSDGNCMPLATDPANRNTIVSRTFSKSFSLAGLRLAYCVGPKALIDAFYKVKDSYNVDRLAQTLALAALDDLPYMRANVAKIRRTRDRLAAELKRRGWVVCPTQTNFVFARPPEGNAAELFDALKRKNIYVRYWPLPRISEFLRITTGTDEQIDALLAELKALSC